MNTSKHKYIMLQILKDIYTDRYLSQYLAFKGGTALMFFYDLGRFSVDLDFNLLDKEQQHKVYEKLLVIAKRYGTIKDMQEKYYGPIIVLDYGKGENNLKIEVSNREYDNHYEMKNLLGINIRVLELSDMFAHKLCALLDRKGMTGRDVYDCYFFLTHNVSINKGIVEERMQMPFREYANKCAEAIEKFSDKEIMANIGELLEEGRKSFVRTKLRQETATLLRFFAEFPSFRE